MSEGEKRLSCPFCGSREAKSRGIKGISGEWPHEFLMRVKECLECKKTFETAEFVWLMPEADVLPGV